MGVSKILDCAALESQARAGDLTGAGDAVSRIAQEFEGARAALATQGAWASRI